MHFRSKHAILSVILLSMLPVTAWAHQDVWLKNEVGDRITSAQNGADPYSPRKTCGGCHPYATITSGYHFQQGFDEMKDGYSERRPWILSPGMFGKWLPTAAAGRLARKVNTDVRQMDLSTYDWIGSGAKYSPRHQVKATSCGGCHPGGGPLEYGRDAWGKADRTHTLAQAEAANTKSLDGDYSSQDTPDRKSHFRVSGVVEADCLICHMPGYGMEKRNEQLAHRNYRWAATAGAGMGTITGAVFTYGRPEAGPGHPQFNAGTWNFSRRPVALYAWSNRRLFTADGRLKGQIIRKSVAAKNCLQCHGEGEAKNVGTLHTAEHDAHVKAGLTCTDCHGLVGKTRPDRLRHQIAKGRSPVLTARNDLDGQGMKTCIGCHHRGDYRASRPGLPKAAKNPTDTHKRRFPQAAFHTYLIGCNGCHVTAQPARALLLLDMGTGQETAYTADRMVLARRSADYAGSAKEAWAPWMVREGAYIPAVPKWMLWFGEKMPNGEVQPIPLRYVQKETSAVSGLSVVRALRPDGAKEIRLSVLSDSDILKMINRLTRMGFRNPVYVADRIYGVEKGKVVAGPGKVDAVHYFVEHGVLPLAGKNVYGGKGAPGGCLDCHSNAAAFFSRMEIDNIRGFLKQDYPVLKEPNAVPQYRSWGLRGVPSFE